MTESSLFEVASISIVINRYTCVQRRCASLPVVLLVVDEASFHGFPKHLPDLQKQALLQMPDNPLTPPVDDLLSKFVDVWKEECQKTHVKIITTPTSFKNNEKSKYKSQVIMYDWKNCDQPRAEDHNKFCFSSYYSLAC